MKRIVTFLIATIVIINSIIFSSFATETTKDISLDNSTIQSDINNITHIDYEKYQINQNIKDYIELIMLLEYNYNLEYDVDKYNVYVYIYNPSGQAIKTEGNYITISTLGPDGTYNTTFTYDLKYISKTTQTDYENSIYKFKISNKNLLYDNVKDTRIYKVNGLKIIFENGKNAYFPTKGTFKFTGFLYNNGNTNIPSLQYEITEANLKVKEENKMATTSNVTINTITEEEAHYNLTERMNERINDITVEQRNNFNEIKNEISNISTLSVISSITTILGVLIIGVVLINKIKEHFKKINTILDKQEQEIKKLRENINQPATQEKEEPLSDNEKEILQIVKNNPEKTEVILKLLK